MLPKTIPVVLVACLPCLACGGPAAPAAPAAGLGTDSGVETFGEVHASDLAELQGAGAADAGAAPASPPPAASAPPAEESKADDCTPVGVDFEKRARPELKACYAEGKKKEPNLKGTVKITVDIDTLGKIRSTKITEKSLPDPVAQCMLKVVKATPLPEAAKCPGKSLTIPMTFPTPR